MEYCPHCMSPETGDYCTRCGGKIRWENPGQLLPVGTVLQGEGHRYQVGAYLGQGGFGVTYIALDLDSMQKTAVKEYFPTQCAMRGPGGKVEAKQEKEELFEGGRYHFVQEAIMLASLEGMPAVVQGLEYMETNGTAYLVMEYLDGTPLYRMVNENGRIPAGELMPRLRPLLRDIGKLHGKGVIHRDISPDNVMWMKDGTLKLLDFGCARAVEDGKSMTVLLKHGFAPVEQYQTRGQGPWTDVYALSATVYYCLTGTIPQTATERLMEDKLQPPTALGAALTPEEEGALLWGMTVNPKQRPGDMAALSGRLFPEADIPQNPTGHCVNPPPPVETGAGRTTPEQRYPGKRDIKSMWPLAAAAAAVIAAIIVLYMMMNSGF